MLFSSITFLYYFLPVMLLVYFLVPSSMKNGVLLIFSLIFYGWGEPKAIVFMMFSIGLAYFAAQTHSKGLLGGVIGIHLMALLCVKLSLFHTKMPIGISFYTFQLISYEVDVYRKKVPVQKDFFKLATYIAMFPQLIAGPIVRYEQIADSLEARTIHYEDVHEGIGRFVFGLAKKVLIANSLGNLCTVFKASQEPSVVFFWMYAFAVTLQIYFDFSGYSDMAIGLGRILGFHFNENFDYPYFSISVTEFWRRWHRSLGQWFRDYVYIPLGGNRTSRFRWLVNLAIVWFLTGFWHGAQWTFILWGLYFAVLLVVEKLFFLNQLEKHPFIGHLYLILVVMIGFVMFHASDVSEGLLQIGTMFGMGNVPWITRESVYYLKDYGVLFILSMIFSMPIFPGLWHRFKDKIAWMEPVVWLFLMIVSTACLVDGSYNPFLYFRF